MELPTRHSKFGGRSGRQGRWLGMAAVILLASAAGSIGAEETPAKGSLCGNVLDAKDAPVVGAAVILCDGETGIPLSAKTYRTLTETLFAGRSPLDVAFALTDDQGEFTFEEIPLGRYALFSQSWPGEDSLKGVFEVNGPEVELHGVARNVQLTAQSSPRVELRPLGTGVLHVDEDLRNDDVYLVISTAAPRADPILGFVGWGGQFAQNIIGGNRMPRGLTTIRGLPQGTVHAVVFASDDSPGWGVGRAEIRPDVTTVTYVPIVAGWSNARHDPPRRLETLVEEIKPLDNLPGILKSHGIDLDDAKGMFLLQQRISRHLATPVTLPSGRKTNGGDLLAALGYARLAEGVKQRERRRERLRALPPKKPAAEPGKPVGYAETLTDLHRELGQRYPCFELKEIDWPAVGAELLPRAKACRTDEEFCHLCLELVARLEDSHASVLEGTAKPVWPEFPAWDPGLACLIDASGQPVIYHLDENGPAKISGVKLGMTVLSINEKPAAEALRECKERLAKFCGYSSDRYLTYQAARCLLRQVERGSNVSLETRDADGGTHQFTLPATMGTRYLPRLPAPIDGISDSADVSCKLLEDDIGYIYVRRIKGELNQSLDQAVAQLADARGLIVDVRGNSGGGFDSGAHLNFEPDQQEEPDRPRFAGPMALLIDARCISAGEGWASWFIAYQRAKVFGSATAGASAKKTTYPLKNGLYQVRFPIRPYIGSLNRPIERRGLEPDVPVHQTAADLAAGRDTVLEAAREYLLNASQ